MTEDLKTKTVCVIDNGLFSDFAIAMARRFGRTLYWCPWVSSFPTRHLAEIGEGLAGVERIKELEDYEDEVDLFVVLDVHFGSLQTRLRRQGRRVWGSMDGEDLELFRWDSKMLQKKLGLPVPAMELIVGMDALEVFLKKNSDVWIKVSEFRGTGETRHHENWPQSEQWFLKLKHSLGPLSKKQEFIIEWPVDTAGEVGYDGFVIDGNFPQQCAVAGFEGKDKIYVGGVLPYNKLPKEVLEVNTKLIPAFKGYGYRGFFSSEIRIGKDDGKPYLIDSTARCPEPPGALYSEWFTNLADIVWAGAGGEIVEPNPIAPYACELILYSEAAAEDWMLVDIPKPVEKFVKLYNHYFDGQHWVVPTDAKLVQIGGALGFGQTIEAAMKQAVEHAQSVCDATEGVEFKKEAIPAILNTIRESKEQGVELGSSPIPESVEA